MQRSYGFTGRLCAVALMSVVFFAGCGGRARENASSAQTATGGEAAPVPNEAASKTASDAASGSPAAGTAQLIKAAASVPRKIIYNAKVELVSDNFGTAQQSLLRLVKTHRGYISDTNVSGTTGAPRQGSWTIRIPETQFEPFMAAVTKLGELQTTQTDSQDVTEEFYDLQARISNKQVEEKRLIEHLNRSTAKLSDILQVEKELSRVRGEIEQMQGRLRLLANLTSLTTVTVTIREVKDYVAPKPATFNTQIARTFSESLGQLGAFGKSIILIFVALLPWIFVMLIGAVPLYFVMRRQQKSQKKVP
ncbi:MAG TPA: DUF4349 domain-containing protein [Abditibacteriaceae bacterium]